MRFVMVLIGTEGADQGSPRRRERRGGSRTPCGKEVKVNAPKGSKNGCSTCTVLKAGA
ncbi:hypothetical protein [Bacillus marinisedimentorum]|uniref:hypothetical protein n=1 Tax=Bacillus marinisedimentorum TaxID=1821260 RepID=UPI0012FF9ACD|nr:hypothetical protein [Bacillus marinisedimentorum]